MPEKYAYPSTNPQLITDLKLIRHPEGEGNPDRSLATQIFYFLSYDEPQGVFHMNKSVTYHVLHQGRAEYTLITPSSSPNSPPTITRVTMGADPARGEVRQLLVPTNVWKMSRIPPADLECATQEEKDKTGCLITEVVVPGFHWEDHVYMTEKDAEELWAGVEGGDALKGVLPFIKKE
ncbi:hypothetical protein HWV62_42820 [Athelia sp. TMB]|nr:hypothetical protein HWV62_18536 [Athelia sp. TMB]KAF7979367.1 hypothetical protein HWV62_42820 [Athelia sp. TMB]